MPGLLDDEFVDPPNDYGDEDHGDPEPPPPTGELGHGTLPPPGRDGLISSPRVSWFQQTRRVGQPGVDETEETHGTPLKGDSLTYSTSPKAPSTGKPGSEGHPGTSQTEGLGSTTSEREPPTGGGVDYYGL